MKKLFVLFAAATLFVGMQACKQKEEAATEEQTEVATTEAPAQDSTTAVAPVQDSTAAAATATPAAETEKK